MKLPVVRLRNKKTGKRLCINERDWAEDLGKGTWYGWERIGELHTGNTRDKVVVNDAPVTPPVDHEAAARAAAGAIERAAKESSLISSAVEAASEIESETIKPKRGRGRPRTVNVDKE